MKPNNHFFSLKNQNSLKMSKKGDFENLKVINHDFSTKSVPEYYGFLNSTVPWGRKNSNIWGPPAFRSFLMYLNLRNTRNQALRSWL